MTEVALTEQDPEGAVWIPNHTGYGIHINGHQTTRVIQLDYNPRELMREKAHGYYRKFVEAAEKELGVKPIWKFGAVCYSL
jgi:hypothetical protein